MNLHYISQRRSFSSAFKVPRYNIHFSSSRRVHVQFRVTGAALEDTRSVHLPASYMHVGKRTKVYKKRAASSYRFEMDTMDNWPDIWCMRAVPQDLHITTAGLAVGQLYAHEELVLERL